MSWAIQEKSYSQARACGLVGTARQNVPPQAEAKLRWCASHAFESIGG